MPKSEIVFDECVSVVMAEMLGLLGSTPEQLVCCGGLVCDNWLGILHEPTETR